MPAMKDGRGVKNVKTARSKVSWLMRLPPEIHGIIADNIKNTRTLSLMSRTCRAWHTIVVPRLYRHLQLAIPGEEGTLMPFERLVASKGDAWKYTTHIEILPCHSNVTDGSFRRRIAEISTSNARASALPTSQKAATHFNILLRMLLRKIAPNRLSLFCWRHGRTFDIETLDVLLEGQYESLRVLEINNYSGFGLGSTYTVKRTTCLTSLVFNSMYGEEWDLQTHSACDMISSSISTLQTLTIGFEQLTIREYEARHGLDTYSRPGGEISKNSDYMIKNLMSCLKHRHVSSKKRVAPSIENLRINSFDLDPKLLHTMGSFIDFSTLVSLRLESCAGLNDGLDRLRTSNSLSRLRSLTVRTEIASDVMWASLEAFICSLIGLTDLCLLMEGDFAEPDLDETLKHHGNTLRSLVVDTRTGPRETAAESTSIQPLKYATESYIADIAEHCPGLIELGVTLDWQAVKSLGSEQEDVFSDILGLPNLKVLNIRNMPESQDESAVEPLLRGLATTIIDLIRSPFHRHPWRMLESGCGVPEIRTIALGALTYRDVYVGEKWREHNIVLDTSTLNYTDDYLQLRVYNVDYCYTVLGKHSPLLTLMTKGCPCDFPPYGDMKILQPYWLK